MKITPRYGVLLLSALFISSSALGGCPLGQQKWEINFGPAFNFARYNFDTDVDCCSPCEKPTCNPCEIPHLQGYLAGLHFDVTHSIPSHWFYTLKFDGKWNAGYVNNTVNDFLQIKDYRPETDFGYTFVLKEKEWYLTPYSGLGFYYLSTEFKNDIFRNRYYNLYVPFGLTALWNIHPECHDVVVECFDAGISVCYRLDAWTRMRVTTDSGVECPNGKCPDLCCDTSCEIKKCDPCEDRLTLTRTHGVHVEFPLTWHPTYKDNLNFIVTLNPFFDWNHFGGTCETNCNGIRIPVPQLNRWHLGFHGEIGINF